MRARGDFAAVVGGLGETETKFLDASAALRDRRRQEEQERQQRELAQAQALAAEQKKRAEEAEKHANGSSVALMLSVRTKLLARRFNLSICHTMASGCSVIPGL
jgi:hypothetical protein